MVDQLEQQTNSQVDTAKTWGGKREGAGRKHGAIQKLSGREILEAIERTLGIDFPTQIALNYQQALYGDDARLKLEYDRLILSKVVADKVDITSNGQTIAPPVINIQKQEISDYIDVKPL
jgi:hypothetical protein